VLRFERVERFVPIVVVWGEAGGAYDEARGVSA